jgi:hypothetical protein
MPPQIGGPVSMMDDNVPVVCRVAMPAAADFLA